MEDDMKAERALSIQADLVGRVARLVREARTYHFTHAYLLEQYNKAMERYPKLPNWVRQYVRGHFDALVNDLYRDALIHAYEWEGELYDNWGSYPEELKQYIRATPTDHLTYGHYWKGTKSAFFLGT